MARNTDPDLWKPLNEHGLTQLSILLAQSEGVAPKQKEFLGVFTPAMVGDLLDLIERANKAFVPGLLNNESMWGMEAREWRADFDKMFGTVTPLCPRCEKYVEKNYNTTAGDLCWECVRETDATRL